VCVCVGVDVRAELGVYTDRLVYNVISDDDNDDGAQQRCGTKLKKEAKIDQ